MNMEPEEKILVDQPVELAAVNDDDDGIPMMTATSYPGQEWNPSTPTPLATSHPGDKRVPSIQHQLTLLSASGRPLLQRALEDRPRRSSRRQAAAPGRRDGARRR
ncbi:hypothetical protein NUW58_g10904 [Xylaria curta]|uniref:Uncharacterized protein n=1 Tax=Xylaria curta TaxID=42375 RepID=A0ACC1MFA9_9PEZI|nr:hypothetical protein NUW58_g10904 [Xylaria curta]